MRLRQGTAPFDIDPFGRARYKAKGWWAVGSGQGEGRAMTLPGKLPSQLRMLTVVPPGRSLHGLVTSLASESGSEIILATAESEAEGLTRLETDSFDLLLLWHQSPHPDALRLLDALAARSRHDLAVVVLGDDPEAVLLAPCLERGADAYLCLLTASGAALLWQIARACERREMLAAAVRHRHAQEQRVQLERDEAIRLVGEQRQILKILATARARARQRSLLVGRPANAAELPNPLENRTGADRTDTEEAPDESLELAADELGLRYRDLLRAYLLMGSGTLSAELAAWSTDVRAAGGDARFAFQLHVAALDELVGELGQRSARHAVSRADLLALELLVAWPSG